jgi:hypothetical protein
MSDNQQRVFERTHATSESSETSPDTTRPVHLKVYKAVDPADSIHRPFPEQHAASFREEEFRKLIAGIDLGPQRLGVLCRSYSGPVD